MENKQPLEQLTRKERKELRRQEYREEKQKAARQQTTKRLKQIALAVIVVGASIGGLVWYLASRPPVSEGEIISRNGLHWHSQLEIFVKGQKQEIAANIGIGAVHQPVHTHDTSGEVHLEFQGVVRREDVKLGRFFQVWSKNIREFGSSVSMTVNGKTNTELESYHMKNGDKIELRYE